MKKLATPMLGLFVVAACGGSAKPTTEPTNTQPTQPTAPAATELTTADQVMEASIVAQGGREAFAKLTSLKNGGTFEISGIKGTFVTQSAPVHESRTTIDLPGFGKLDSGVHGDVAWEKTPTTGSRIVTGPELALTLRDSTFNGDLVWKQLFPKAEFQGVVEFAGTQAYKLLMTAADGETETRYIAKDTKLPLGVEMVANSQMGKVPVIITSTDYRDVHGLKFAFRTENKTAGQVFTVVLQTVEPNAPLDPKSFDLPDDIKALQKK